MLAEATHPVHFSAFVVAMLVNVLGLLWLNSVKASGFVPQWSWAQKRTLYWAYLLCTIAFSCWLDRHWDIHELFMPIKAYALVFPFGLIDYYFSENKHMSPRVFVGAALWGSTLWLRVALERNCISPDLTLVVDDFSPLSLAKEALRFVVAAPFCSMFTDLIFSPLHRLEHRFAYASHHKEHHNYVDKINSLVLYHGAYLDDFMMPVTTIIGYFAYARLCCFIGMEASAFSNISEWLLLFNTLLSHAHDERCASLILPVPDSLNFAAYHRVHHLNVAKNFGLTLPSDMVWDRILGVNTICTDRAAMEEDATKKVS
ncbi:unnamed protein product [Polarella glacialis]|uniref:Fatty acid hydroxylase domain-containing protein n=1 Tax=Polarella glacialis TaxID=89957 RepID=A0A813JT26_POLGL|nr:unnamed protein product [Polarella glacialis]CAE8684372.1 unnamed protein product [Polarella glacialis]